MYKIIATQNREASTPLNGFPIEGIEEDMITFNLGEFSSHYKKINERLANIMNISLHILTALDTSFNEKISSLIAVIAITITIIGLTKPALTAASPSTSAPTIESALPNAEGALISVSLKISKVTFMISASNIVGNGTPSFCMAKLIRRLGGSTS